jgi:chromosome segregation ATPase
MTFTDKEQKEHRAVFIQECRQKAWGALCHAELISKGLDELMADYTKLQEEDATIQADIKELEAAVDSHTVENRNKRKALNERRQNLGQQMTAIGQNMQMGQKSLTQLHQSVESNLALAKHAETWQWATATKEIVQAEPGS